MRGRVEQLKELQSKLAPIFSDPSNEEHLKVMWESSHPQKCAAYEHLCKDLTTFEKLLLLAAYRPDRLIPAVRTFVADTLGKIQSSII